MSETKDGGPAFPLEEYGIFGMTLRDYFAGQALAGMVISDAASSATIEAAAAHFYRIADAMLVARSARTMEADKDPRDDDIAVLLAEIDAARAMDDTLWDDPEDIALIEQIRAGLKARIGEAA